MQRLIRRKTALNVVKEIDAFPKIAENYVETSASGGTISLISFLLIVLFIVSEFKYYSTTKFTFKYSVDADLDSKLRILVDLTVAMPCDSIGADVLDATNQPASTFGKLNHEPCMFELNEKQRNHWNTIQQVNLYIREEFHAIQDLLWRSGFVSMFGNMPKRPIPEGVTPDACRIYGALEVNKVSGNFHVTAGKTIPYPRGHAHLALMSDSEYNFTHRIERFSFGGAAAGIVNPLDGEEKYTHSHNQVYHYYIQVVPTDINTMKTKNLAYQYSVSELAREINHEHGSHGVPGIFFKYDISSIKVKVTEERQPLWQFVVRLCGIVGGIFATSGIINSFVSFVIGLVCCGFYRKTRVSSRPVVESEPLVNLIEAPVQSPIINPTVYLPTSPVTISGSTENFVE